jgi:hypothetical protein
MNNTAINNHFNNNSTNHSKLHMNIKQNIDIIKNLKYKENSYKKFTKLTEYLCQMKNKDIKDIKDNFIQKTKYHKKNSVSISSGEKKNLFFNVICKKNLIKSNNNNRINKKKLIIKKNLKTVLSNINNTYMNHKKGHTKNKTFDFNIINSQTINLSQKNPNISNINIDEIDTIFNKPKK